MVKTRVICVRKDDDEVPLLLDHLVHLDSSAGEQLGRDHTDLVAEEVEADPGPVREQLLGGQLELVGVTGRDAVPGLGRPVVEVVDPVQVHVLNVPREGGLPHAKVQVGPSIDSG